MAHLLLVGARQLRAAGVADRDHGPLYDEGRVIALDTRTGDAAVRLRYAAPRPWSPPGAGQAFKGAAWDGPELLLCQERELVWVDPERWTATRTLSHPWFNDLHHAARLEGRLVVASTGIDCALTFDGRDRDPVAVPLVPGARPEPTVDYRGLDTRPHRAHPNHLFAAFGRVWVTRAHQRDAVCLDGAAPPASTTCRLEVGQERVHDGVLHEDRVWFTTVDGHLVAVDRDGGREVVPLRGEADGPLGWCRGLRHAEGLVWVGFTRIRATRFRSHLAWVRGQLRGTAHATHRPTRLVGFDRSGRPRASHDLEGLGLDALFAVLNRDGP